MRCSALRLAMLLVVATSAPRASRAAERFDLAITAMDEETNAAPAGDSAGGMSEEELAKLSQNPVANLISIPFQQNFNFGIGPRDATQWVMNVQPVVPFSINENWNLITRTIVPVINLESPAPGISSEFGMGDVSMSLFLSPAEPGQWIWGAGPILAFPTGTEPVFTSGKWSAGPAAVALQINGDFVYGCLVSQLWSYAGWGDESVNLTTIQPFINYNLPDGWYLTTVPLITADWSADDSDDVWTVPVGGGIGKIVKLGKLPVNFQLQAFENVVKPDNAADWQLRFQMQILLPKSIFK